MCYMSSMANPFKIDSATYRGEGMFTHCSRTTAIIVAARVYAAARNLDYFSALAIVQARTDNRKDS
jgi:hypothetical protein